MKNATKDKEDADIRALNELQSRLTSKRRETLARLGEDDDQRDLAKRRSMIAQKGSAKTKSDMRKAVEEVKTQDATNRAYEESMRLAPVKKAAGGMVKKRGMGAATRGGNCKMY
jgi:hypothetical protein